MRDASKELRTGFVGHHRTFTRGLYNILQDLDHHRISSAIARARDLDRKVGPHIEFEEQVLYPCVAGHMGQEYVDQLYEEHQVALGALKTLQAHEGAKTLSPEIIADLRDRLRIALDHAVSCGTLLSHLTTMPMADQIGMLEKMEQFNAINHSWSELTPSSSRQKNGE